MERYAIYQKVNGKFMRITKPHTEHETLNDEAFRRNLVEEWAFDAPEKDVIRRLKPGYRIMPLPTPPED